MGDTRRRAYDRQELFDFLLRCPHRGREIVRLNERDAARKLGWHRATVGRALSDLEHEGLVRRFRVLGHTGILIQLLSQPTP
jgi:DNA-binding IclR family transcriptional regulator